MTFDLTEMNKEYNSRVTQSTRFPVIEKRKYMKTPKEGLDEDIEKKYIIKFIRQLPLSTLRKLVTLINNMEIK